MTTSDKSQQTDLFPMELELMSSLEASPAKTSPLQGIKQVLKASVADSGQSAPVFLGRFDPGTPSLKTSQTCFLENGEIGLSEFSATFPRSGMMRSGTVYQLPRLAPTITEIGCGSSVTQTQTFYWRTPDTGNGGTPKAFLKGETHRESGHAIQVRLSDQVKMWPTPTSNSAGEGKFIEQLVTKDGKKAAQNQRAYNPKTGIHTHITLNRAVQLWPTPRAGNPGSRPNGKGGKILNEEVMIAEGLRERGEKLWPTPSTRDYKGGYIGGRMRNGKVSRDTLDVAVQHTDNQEKTNGTLNPTWVEWLMGFPIGHTDLNA